MLKLPDEDARLLDGCLIDCRRAGASEHLIAIDQKIQFGGRRTREPFRGRRLRSFVPGRSHSRHAHREEVTPISEAAPSAVLRTACVEAPAEPIPVLRPLLPCADQLLPDLRRIDETRLDSNHGPLFLELERRLAEAFRLPPDGLVTVSSGTAALVGAILASAGRSLDRPLAIIPALTFAPTAAAIEQCGYRPYLAGVGGESWMLDPARLVDHPKREQLGLVVRWRRSAGRCRRSRGGAFGRRAESRW